MQPATAWILAAVTGAGAVGLVTVDLAYTLTARIESLVDGVWVVHEENPPRDEDHVAKPFPDDRCASPRIRVIVDNHRPIAAEPHVRITYWAASNGTTVLVLEETWRLAAFEERIHEFTVPDGAFSPGTSGPDGRLYVGTDVSVTVQAGDELSVYTCVRMEE